MFMSFKYLNNIIIRLTCEPTNNVYHGSNCSFFPRLIASQTMSRFLLVVLALFAVSDSYLSLLIYSLIICSHLMPIVISLLSIIQPQVADVQVAFARLKTDVSSSSATSSSPQQIRKAYHSRPHLASDSIWKDDAKNLQIVADFCEISELYQEGL